MTHRYWSRLAITSLLGLVLSYAFVFLAALPIRYLRLTFGRKTFLLTTIALLGVVVTFGHLDMAISYGSICLLIGFYRELEEKNVSIFFASLFAVLTTMSANIFALMGYARISGSNIQNFMTEKAQPLLLQIQQIPRFQEATLESLIWYLPSMFTITLMIVIFVSLTAVNRLPLSRNQNIAVRMFRLPDWMVWVFIASLGGTFVQTTLAWLPLVSMNVLAVTLAGYFFQGLAVFTHFLDRLRIFGFWRMLAYFLVFFQMFIFISGLGILDYWFDFRVQGLTGSDSKNIKRSTK